MPNPMTLLPKISNKRQMKQIEKIADKGDEENPIALDSSPEHQKPIWLQETKTDSMTSIDTPILPKFEEAQKVKPKSAKEPALA